MNNVKELLPIGSVVMLKGAKKAVMVFGIKQTEESSKKEYDYIGVMYPEGNMGVKSQFLFNHDAIEKVCFRGYEDEQREQFIEKISGFYDKKDN